MAGIDFKAKSLLAFLTAVSFIGWLGGTALKTTNESFGSQIVSISIPIFIICFGIWLIFIFLTIARNIKGL